MTGSLFEPAARLRATSARLSSLNGAIFCDGGFLDFEWEASEILVNNQGRIE